MSPPSRTAWIEIDDSLSITGQTASPPSRAAWIEIKFARPHLIFLPSPPSRAAWIEMEDSLPLISPTTVAAFTGGVD